VIGVAPDTGRRGLALQGAIAGISREHCSLFVRDGRVVLEDHSRHGSFLNGQCVAGTVALVAGDRLRMGSPGIELLLVCVVDNDGATAD
jgi:pSer/pThr/pTyr-binding forkhead associated (FHA) protein